MVLPILYSYLSCKSSYILMSQLSMIKQNTPHQFPTDYKQICKTKEYTLLIKISEGQILNILLYVFHYDENIMYMYEGVVRGDSQVGQALDSVNDLADYLEINENFRINEAQKFICVISKTQVKGRIKQIQICKIQLELNKKIPLQNQHIVTFNQIADICAKDGQITNFQIKKFIFTIVSQLRKSQFDFKDHCEKMIDPVINKILFLGEEQYLTREKLGGICQKIGEFQSTLISNYEGINKTISDAKIILEDFKLKLEKSQDKFMTSKKQIFQEIDYLRKAFNKYLQKLKTNNFSNMKIQPFEIMEQLERLEKDRTFQFSKSLKNKGIKLLHPFLVHGDDSSRSKLALVYPPINEKHHAISFKIIKNPFDILIGVCNVDFVKQSQFQVERWGNGNHGGYYINSGGWCYSYFNKSENDVQKSFQYQTSDVISVHFSIPKKTITFRKGDKICQLSYDPEVKLGKLHFCVVMHGTSCEVQLVSV